MVTDGRIDWHISSNLVRNRTGSWYFGVVAIKTPSGKNVSEIIMDETKCKDSKLSKDLLDWDFGMKYYTMVAYGAGGYAFNLETDTWESIGMGVLNTTKLVTAFTTNHLTGFATGFLPQPNTIDFNFVFAHASFQDNMTIFILVILTFIFYFSLMIWATIKDIKDVKKVNP